MHYLLLVIVVCIFYAFSIDCILDGHEVSEKDCPYQVLIHLDNVGMISSGVILNQRTILTSAYPLHVWNVQDSRSLHIVIGTIYRLSKNIQIDIENIIKHSEFDLKTRQNDIGLLRTKKDIIYTIHIQPVRFPLHDLPAEDENVKICGWGIANVSKNIKLHKNSYNFITEFNFAYS